MNSGQEEDNLSNTLRIISSSHYLLDGLVDLHTLCNNLIVSDVLPICHVEGTNHVDQLDLASDQPLS